MNSIFSRALNNWDRLWFKDETQTPLEIVRIGVSLALIISYLSYTPQLTYFFSDDGAISVAMLSNFRNNPWHQSIFYYFTENWQLYVFHSLFLFSIMSLGLGWRTNWVKWIVLVGHISYLHRNPGLYYGVDNILASLIFILCVVPIGKALSLDRVREIRRLKKLNLLAMPLAPNGRYQFAAVRLIQIQMAIFFLYAGIEKLRGPSWWSGDALWITVNSHEYSNMFAGLFATHYWIINLLTYSTLVIELAFPFLIWGKHTRVYLLIAAILLHVGIAVMMGLYLFSLAMIVGHLAFVRPEWLQALGCWWKQKIGAMEIVYDGDCGFCKRSMAWLLALDGLRQITIRNYRTDPSPVVASELVDRALYVVLSDNRSLPGFDAYRYIVARVPGLWWMIPFFYVPYFSRAIGRPVYNWIATHRHVISTCMVDQVRTIPTNTEGVVPKK